MAMEERKEKIILVGQDEETEKKTSMARNGRLIVKFLFGSTSMILIALSILSMAIINGDALSRFAGGALYNFNGFLINILGQQFAFLAAYLVSAIMLMGPLHYYAEYNLTDMLVIMMLTFFILGVFIARMFKNPIWSFFGGMATMIGFDIMVYAGINVISYTVSSMLNVQYPIDSLIEGLVTGAYNTDSFEMLLVISAVENGAFLGLCSFFWSAAIYGNKGKKGLDTAISCNGGGICEI